MKKTVMGVMLADGQTITAFALSMKDAKGDAETRAAVPVPKHKGRHCSWSASGCAQQGEHLLQVAVDGVEMEEQRTC
jgi:hypothetical protein